MGRLLRASAAALLVFAVAAPPSTAQPGARAAAANSLEVTATNATPTDQVGRAIHVRLQGAIVAKSKRLVPRRCRASREIAIFNQKVEPPAVTRREDLKPTPRSGRFDGVVFPYDYGGIDSDGEPRSGDVPFAGGTLTLEVVVKKATVFGKDFTKPRTCRSLRETVTVGVPPSSG